MHLYAYCMHLGYVVYGSIGITEYWYKILVQSMEYYGRNVLLNLPSA